MPDPKDEVPLMQRFDRLLKAMATQAPPETTEADDQASGEAIGEDCAETQTPKGTSEDAS
jgi:hypothetical protein